MALPALTMTLGALSVVVLLVLVSGCYEARPSVDGGPPCPPLFSDGLNRELSEIYQVKCWGAHTGNATWKIEDGGLVYSGGALTGGGECFLLVGDQSWTDYSVEADVTPIANIPGSAPMLTLGLVGRYEAPESHYRLYIHTHNLVILVSGEPGKPLAGLPVVIDIGRSYHLRLEMRGDRITGKLDGADLLEAASPASTQGRAGLFAAAGTARFNDLVVKSLTCR